MARSSWHLLARCTSRRALLAIIVQSHVRTFTTAQQIIEFIHASTCLIFAHRSGATAPEGSTNNLNHTGTEVDYRTRTNKKLGVYFLVSFIGLGGNDTPWAPKAPPEPVFGREELPQVGETVNRGTNQKTSNRRS